MKYLNHTIVLLFLTFSLSNAQTQKPVASPPATATGTINNAEITIQYSSPSVKGRTIWGELVPYDKLWRAGANKSTTFTTSKDITIENKSLPAGSYSLFVIPGQAESTVVFNKVTGGSGTNGYDEAQDQVRVQVKNEAASSPTEKLTYAIEKDRVVLKWADRNLPIRIK